MTTSVAKQDESISLIIEKSNRNKRLMKPVVTQIAATTDIVTLDIQRYIIESLSSLTPSLIPFALRNKSIIQLAKYFKYDCSASHSSLAMYTYNIARFCQQRDQEPDDLIAECTDPDGLPNSKAIAKATQHLDQYYMQLKAEQKAPKTVGVWIAMIKSFYRVNNIVLPLTRKLGGKGRSRDRAPTPDELQRVVDIADLRGKVIITMQALGSFREGTLSQLRYRHIKHDYERDVIPIHVHVEAEITKGKYHDYDTFLGKEAADYLRAYLEERQKGSPCGKIPPETISDDTPLIRDRRSKAPKPVYPGQIYDEVHKLYYKTGLLGEKRFNRYEVRPHSIRKFFRTQLAALGVDRDYIEYMMGHTISTYHDIQMKGIEFLRNVYIASGLSIRPKAKITLIDTLKAMIKAHGEDPEKYLVREAFTQPHRTYVNPLEREEDQVKILSHALKEMMRKELLDAK